MQIPNNRVIGQNPENAWLLYAAACLGLLSWLIPEHYPPWNTFYNEFAAFLGLGALILYVALTIGRDSAIAPRWILIILLLALVPLIQATVGHISFAGDGWMAWAYMTAFALACIAGHIMALKDNADFASAMAWLLLAGALISTFVAMYQWLGLEGMESWIFYGGVSSNRPGANLAQPNHLATLLCLGLAGAIYLFSKKHIGVVTSVLIASLLIFGVALTQSRMPWVIAAFILFWWFVKGRSIPGAPGRGIVYGLLLYIGLIVLWPNITATELTPANGQRGDLTDPGSRIAMWDGLLQALWQQPWSGYGWNQVSIAHLQTAQDYPLPEMVTHSHNLLLDLLLWNGLPLGMLIIAGLGYWLITRARRCNSHESWFGLLAIGVVGVHSLLEYPHDFAYFLLPVGLLAGMVDADLKAARVMRLPRPLLWMVLILYAVFMGLVWHEYRIVEEDYRLARFEERRIGPLKASQPAPDLILLTQLREDLRYMRTEARENMSDEQLAWMRKLAYRYPYYASLFRYALALALNDRIPEARTEILRLGHLYGQGPYEHALDALRILADSRYPQLQQLLEQLP